MIDDGLLVGTGIAKYGYRYEQHKRAINEEEAEVIRRIFALGADGKSLSEIALALNVENIPGPKTTWHVQAVYRVLTDASYYGAPFIRNKEIGTDSLNIKGRRKYKRNDRSQWVPVGNDTPPIVDKQIWEAANRNLKDRNKRPHKKDGLYCAPKTGQVHNGG